MAKGGAGKAGGGKGSPMTGRDSARVQSAAARNPGSSSAASGFAGRAQSAAARNTSGGRADRGGAAKSGRRG